jgi:hypothetical protein
MGADSVRMTVESGTILASTHFDRVRQKVNGAIDLKGAEGLVIDLDHL